MGYTQEFNQSQVMGDWNVPPDIVFMILGTNDANSYSWPTYKDQYVPSYKALIKVYTDLGADVYVMIPPPAFRIATPNYNLYNLLQPVINNDLPTLLTGIAKSSNVTALVSIHDLFKWHSPVITNETLDCDWVSGAGFGTPPTPPFDDGIHPNTNGYYAIAAKMMHYLLP